MTTTTTTIAVGQGVTVPAVAMTTDWTVAETTEETVEGVTAGVTGAATDPGPETTTAEAAVVAALTPMTHYPAAAAEIDGTAARGGGTGTGAAAAAGCRLTTWMS